MVEDLKRVGFVGFGAMARRMAARLRNAGYQVSAFDVAHDGGEVDGFPMVASVADLAGRIDAALVVVPNDSALRTAVTTSDGLLAHAARGLLLIDHSTVSPTASVELGKAAAGASVAYVEAPMSGSTPEAEKGELVFLAGGEAADVERAAPLLNAMGRSTVHVGPVGAGAVAKLVVNGVMALGTAALAEGLGYGTAAGVDRDVLIDVLSDLILVSEHHKRKLAMAKAGSYPSTFPTRLMSKDMGLLLADAHEREVPLPTMTAAARLYVEAARAHPDDDYAAVIETAAPMAGGRAEP